MSTPATGPKPPPPPAPPPPMTPEEREKKAKEDSERALDTQARIVAESIRFNTSMAWLQMALGMAGKIAGR